jgi:hypothetical protein
LDSRVTINFSKNILHYEVNYLVTAFNNITGEDAAVKRLKTELHYRKYRAQVDIISPWLHANNHSTFTLT